MRKVFFIIPLLLLLVLQSKISCANSLQKFSITATAKVPLNLLANGIAHAQYRVINNTKLSRTLTIVPIKGVRQTTAGIGACTYPFFLAPGQSCLLSLELIGSELGQGLHSGPVVCKTRSLSDNSPDPLLCSQPSAQDSLNINIIPCQGKKCLSQKISNQLRAITTAVRQQYHVPGLVAGIWIPGQGELIIEDGVSNILTNTPMNKDNHFRIGSITKTFTLTVILQLVNETLVGLHDQISAYSLGVTHNSNATIYQLGNMRSGIFDYTENPGTQQEYEDNPLKIWFVQDLIQLANNNLPYFAPNDNWHYSNTNTVLLGMLIQNLTNVSPGIEIYKRILQPLGLKNTFYPMTPTMPLPFSSGYVDETKDVTYSDPSYAQAAGAMISSLADLRIWAVALGRGRLLPANLYDQQRSSLEAITFNPCPDTVVGRPKVSCPEYDKYGVGIGELKGWIGHTGDYLGYSSLMMYDPKTQGVIVILINFSGAKIHIPTDLFKRYLKILVTNPNQ